jgi:hypothetical protein
MIDSVTRAGPGRRAAWASLLLALVASSALLLVPFGTRVTATTAGSPSPPVVTHHSLLEHEGASVLPVLAVPALAAALGVAGSRRPVRALSAGLLWAFSVLGAMSIGLYYVPAAVVMTVAAWARPFSGAGTSEGGSRYLAGG